MFFVLVIIRSNRFHASIYIIMHYHILSSIVLYSLSSYRLDWTVYFLAVFSIIMMACRFQVILSTKVTSRSLLQTPAQIHMCSTPTVPIYDSYHNYAESSLVTIYGTSSGWINSLDKYAQNPISITRLGSTGGMVFRHFSTIPRTRIASPV